ncbi:hypothetical protein O181_010226 [Austropuccinia psidii MF-1]|uniref:Uncharacterized protein n=1 Tax=Austropuccinia psidii MF-1 TaxID=1389203 RepID=A0A9Q3BTC8_9BASI|nr:hypothetical protein [Austropuccinia psidii MF-1]
MEVKNNEDLYSSILPEIGTYIIKEMRRDNIMIQARDGEYIVPETEVFNTYIEQELETVIISRDQVEDKISQHELNHPHFDQAQTKKVKFEDETMENTFNQLKDLNKKIK